jgi:hypothetical protein
MTIEGGRIRVAREEGDEEEYSGKHNDDSVCTEDCEWAVIGGSVKKISVYASGVTLKYWIVVAGKRALRSRSTL